MAQHILIYCDNHDQAAVLNKSLRRSNCNITDNTATDGDLLALATRAGADMIIVAMRQTSMTLLAGIQKILQHRPMPIIVFVNTGDEYSAAAATQAGVSAYVIDGLREDRIVPILTAARLRFENMQQMQQALLRTQTALSERKQIERAKGLLMKQRNCSEEDAYIALRKMAMEKNLRLVQVAEKLIVATELLN